MKGPRVGLNIGEAEAVAAEQPDLVWLDVADEDYYDERNLEPER